MNDVQFFRTRMGQKFYEVTLPSIVTEISRLNDNLERLVRALERRATAHAPEVPATEEDGR